MSLLGRRAYSTARHIVPPKIATPNVTFHLSSVSNIKVVGGAKLPPYLQWITNLYARIPKGSPPKRETKGFWAWYREKYMHGPDGASFAPVVHLYIAMVLFGYTYQVD